MELCDNFIISNGKFGMLSNVGYCRWDSSIRPNWAVNAPTLNVGAFLKKLPESSAALHGYSEPTPSVLHPSIMSLPHERLGLVVGQFLVTMRYLVLITSCFCSGDAPHTIDAVLYFSLQNQKI